MRLGLQSDTDVFDRRGERGVDYTCEGSRSVILAVGQRSGGRARSQRRGETVLSLEVAAGVVEAAELDGDAGTDTDQRCQRAFVEGGGALVAQDLSGAVEGTCVACRGL